MDDKNKEAVVNLIATSESAEIILDYMERNRLPHFTIMIEVPKKFIEEFKAGSRDSIIQLKYNFKTKGELDGR